MINAAKAYRNDARAPIPVIAVPQRADTGPKQDAAELARFMNVYDAEGAVIEAGFIPDETNILLGQPQIVRPFFPTSQT